MGMIGSVQWISLVGELCTTINMMDEFTFVMPISLNLGLFSGRTKLPPIFVKLAGQLPIFGFLPELALCREEPETPEDLVTADSGELFGGNVFFSVMSFALILPIQFAMSHAPFPIVRSLGRSMANFPILQITLAQGFFQGWAVGGLQMVQQQGKIDRSCPPYADLM